MCFLLIQPSFEAVPDYIWNAVISTSYIIVYQQCPFDQLNFLFLQPFKDQPSPKQTSFVLAGQEAKAETFSRAESNGYSKTHSSLVSCGDVVQLSDLTPAGEDCGIVTCVDFRSFVSLLCDVIVNPIGWIGQCGLTRDLQSTVTPWLCV